MTMIRKVDSFQLSDSLLETWEDKAQFLDLTVEIRVLKIVENFRNSD